MEIKGLNGFNATLAVRRADGSTQTVPVMFTENMIYTAWELNDAEAKELFCGRCLVVGFSINSDKTPHGAMSPGIGKTDLPPAVLVGLSEPEMK